MSFEIFYKSFFNYLREKYVKHIPEVKYNFLNKNENIIYAIFRYSNIISIFNSRHVVETDFFNSCKLKINDCAIIQKIEKLKTMIERADREVYKEKDDVEKRFIAKRFGSIFDKNGMPVSDFIFDTLGIMHFHIGYTKETDDNLLFVYVKSNIIYFLCIGTHNDIYIESPGSIVLEVYLKEFPEDAEKYLPKLPANDVTHTVDIKMARVCKSNAINISFKDADGNIRTSISPYTKNRMPLYIVRNFHNVEMELYSIYNSYNIKKLKFVSLEYIDEKYTIMLRNMDDIDNLNFIIAILDKSCAMSKLYNCLFSIIKFLNLEDHSSISLVKERYKSRKNIKRITRAKQIAEAKLSKKLCGSV